MKTKRYVKSWLKSYGEISLDHLKFSAILAGRLVDEGVLSLGEIEEQTGMKMRRLKNFVKKRPRTIFDENHKIAGHGPIVLETTNQVLKIGDKTVYTPTPWDALLSVFYLDREVVWKTSCSLTGEAIEVKVLSEGIETKQEGIYISFLHPDEMTNDKLDAIKNWCVPLLKDDIADQFLEQHQQQVAIPLSQAYQFARDVFFSWASSSPD